MSWRAFTQIADPLVAAVKAGFGRLDSARVGQEHTRYLPFPVVVAGGAVPRCLNRTHAPGSAFFFGDAQGATGFLIMARHSSIHALRRSHVRFYSLLLTVELAVYKGNEAGMEGTQIVNILVFGPTDHIFMFFQLL